MEGNHVYGILIQIFLDQQWILMCFKRWKFYISVKKISICTKLRAGQITFSINTGKQSLIQRKIELNVNSVSSSWKAFSHTCEYLVSTLLHFKNSLASFWVPLYHPHDQKKTMFFSLPIPLPPNLWRQFIPLEALGSSDGMNKWRWWQQGIGTAASPQHPLPGASHVAAPVPSTAAVQDRPSVQSSRNCKSSLSGKLSTQHITFPSPPESCRWEKAVLRVEILVHLGLM